MQERVDKDRYFLQNVIGISGVEFLYGLGLPVVVESTFLQIFLKKLGASNFAIGLIPFFFFLGTSAFALLSSYYTANMAFKRKAVIGLHLVSAISILLIGISLFIFSNVSHILFVFLGCYALFSISVGMTMPVWLNYLVTILSEDKSVAGLSFMIIAQNIAKLLSSMLILRIVDTYAFSQLSSALIFLAVGLFFFLGSLLFLVTKELNHAHETPPAVRQTFFRYVVDNGRHVLKNKNYLFFLAGDFEFFIVITVISFYANYATAHCGIDPAVAAGVFVGCIYTGAIFTNILLGTMGMFSLKTKCIITKISSISAVMLLSFVCYSWGFYLASFLLGLSRGARLLVYPPAVKKLSGLSDSTSYFAIGPILTLPFAVILPLVTGKFLDHNAALQAGAYRMVFLTAALLIFFTLLSILKTNFDVPAKTTQTT
jgi:MFS family permease